MLEPCKKTTRSTKVHLVHPRSLTSCPSLKALVHVMWVQTVVVQTLQTEETTDFVERFPKPRQPPESDISISTDHSEVRSDYIFVADGPSLYKLLMRVPSGTHSRLIDPSLAILKLSQQLPAVCKHAKIPVVRSLHFPRMLKSYPFKDLLGR